MLKPVTTVVVIYLTRQQHTYNLTCTTVCDCVTCHKLIVVALCSNSSSCICMYGTVFFLQTEPVSQQLQERDWPAALADGTSQLVTPSAIQLVSTPLHLVGLDLFNRPDATAGMRLALVKRLYASSVALRFGRTAISFGMVSTIACKLRLRTVSLCNGSMRV
jgi:hypothetical protein